MPLVAIQNLGCRVNRVEADSIAQELESHGVEIGSLYDASIVVINTCAVTGEAEAKTRKALRHATQLPQKPLVIACGCVATLFPKELEALASNIVVEKDKTKVAARIIKELNITPATSRVTTFSSHVTATGRSRPGIKIQDGCNNRCTFCLVWKARGKAWSVPAPQIVAQIEDACARGAHEIVLTGINVGSYEDTQVSTKTFKLPELIRYILQKTPIERVRISSIEPLDVTRELVDCMAQNPERVAHFLHVCLQSGSDETLTRMRRLYSTKEYETHIAYAREKLSNLSLGTDIIVGFPGETKEEFQASYEFCKRMNFSNMHIFRYSKRNGTVAAQMENQISPKTMAIRSEIMHELAHSMRMEHAKQLIGTQQRVLVQEDLAAITEGLFDVKLDQTATRDSFVSCVIDSVNDDTTLNACVST